MSERDRPRSRVFARLLVLGAVPAVVLDGLYAGSALVGFEFGNTVFGLTVVVVLAWIVMTGSESGGLRRAAASRGGSLFGMDERYAEEVAEGRIRRYSDPGLVLVVLLATVVLGWLVLILSLL